MEMAQMRRQTHEQLNDKVSRILDSLKGGWGSGGSTSVESFVSLWCERFDSAQRDLTFDTNSAQFQTDLSSIHLRGTGVVSVLLVGGSGPAVKNAVNRFRHDGWFGWALPVVVFAADSAFAMGLPLLPGRRGLVFSPSQIAHVLGSDDPTKELRFEMVRQMPYQRLIPFSVSRPAVGAMFFGRHNELGQLLHEDHVEYALWGAGDMGKSSLLRQVEWRLRRDLDPRYRRIVEVDLQTCGTHIDAMARFIAQRVYHTRFSHELTLDGLEPFLRRMRFQDSRFRSGPIELLIDEADEVLPYDRRRGYPLMKALRHARRADLIRLTLCGRSAPKEVFEDPTNPFRGEMKGIFLEPLAPGDAVNLLLQPLEHLGVEFQDRNATLKTVLSACRGNPCLIQRWGSGIANRTADHPQHRFTVADLREIRKRLAERIAA